MSDEPTTPKPFYLSTTMWGGLLSFVAASLVAAKVVSADVAASLVSQLPELIVGFIGAGLTWYGRAKPGIRPLR